MLTLSNGGYAATFIRDHHGVGNSVWDPSRVRGDELMTISLQPSEYVDKVRPRERGVDKGKEWATIDSELARHWGEMIAGLPGRKLSHGDERSEGRRA